MSTASAPQYPSPPQLENAQEQLFAAIEQREKKRPDPLTTPWAELEKSVIPLLGGPFQMNQPQHQVVALALASVFAQRLSKEHQSFWFLNRDSPEGASVGFPDALIMLSPLGAVLDAFGHSKLERLEDIAKDIRNSLAQVKFGAGAPPQRLTPVDYQRLFDPGLVQFVAVDAKKVAPALDSPPDKLAREIREAVGRTQQLPPELKQQLEGQLVMGLQRLEAGVPLKDQLQRGPRVGELVAHLYGTVGGSGAAPEELWTDVVFPLLYIGAPTQFPPLDDEEKQALEQGLDPLFVYLDVVPYKTPAPEDGLMGAFALDELSLVHPAFQKAGAVRLIQTNSDRFKQVLSTFDAQRTRDSVAQFIAYAEKESGKKVQQQDEGKSLLDAAVTLLSELQKSAGLGPLCVRRITEAEATSEAVLHAVRQSLGGPRIILAP